MAQTSTPQTSGSPFLFRTAPATHLLGISQKEGWDWCGKKGGCGVGRGRSRYDVQVDCTARGWGPSGDGAAAPAPGAPDMVRRGHPT
eukprot:1350082-Rhodomonas_salina.1